MKTTINRIRKARQGRTWEDSDGEGSWGHGEHCIGCGAANGSKWQIWDGPQASRYEYKTLREAMEACY